VQNRGAFLAILALTGAAVAAPADSPAEETPLPEVSEIRSEKKPPQVVDTKTRPIPAPVVRPIPADKLLSYRHEPIALPFEWDSQRGWIDRRR
jgi:hypothetical protein